MTAGEILEILPQLGLSLKINELVFQHKDNSLSCTAATLNHDGFNPVIGYSAGEQSEARAKAVIEGFERYVFTHLLNRKAVSTDSMMSSGIPMTDQNWFRARYGENAINLPSLNSYYLSRRLIDGNSFGLSALLVKTDEEGFQITNSGFACFANPEGAALNSCWEVIERDILLRAWFEERVPQALTVETSSPLLSAVSSLLAQRGFQLRMATFPNLDLIPVTAAVISSVEHGLIFVGTGLGASLQESYEKAVREAFQIWAFDMAALDKGYKLSPENQAIRMQSHFDEIQNFMFEGDATLRSKGQPCFKQIISRYDFYILSDISGIGPPCTKAYSPFAFPHFSKSTCKLLPADVALKKPLGFHPFW